MRGIGPFVVITSGVCLLGCGSPGGECFSTCETSVTLSTSYQPPVFFLDGGSSPIVDATVRVCLDTTLCSSGTMTNAWPVTLSGAFPGQAALDGNVLDISVNPKMGALRDGDSWSLTVTAADGSSLFDSTRTTTYTHETTCQNTCAMASIQM